MPFITVVDTVFQGRVAAWRDEDGKPCVWETQEGAEGFHADEEDGVLEVIVTDDKIYDPIDGRVYWQRVEL